MYSIVHSLQHNVLDLNVSDVECSVSRIVRIIGCCQKSRQFLSLHICVQHWRQMILMHTLFQSTWVRKHGSISSRGKWFFIFSGKGVKLTTHLCLLPTQRMNTAIPLSSMSSWRIKKQLNFYSSQLPGQQWKATKTCCQHSQWQSKIINVSKSSWISPLHQQVWSKKLQY